MSLDVMTLVGRFDTYEAEAMQTHIKAERYAEDFIPILVYADLQPIEIIVMRIVGHDSQQLLVA